MELEKRIENPLIIRSRKILVSFVGLLSLTSCSSDQESYSPKVEDTCTVITGEINTPKIEASRWSSNSSQKLKNLAEEISDSMVRLEGESKYGLCLDQANEFHALEPMQVEQVVQYFGYTDEGFNLKGIFDIPAVIPSDEFTVEYEL